MTPSRVKRFTDSLERLAGREKTASFDVHPFCGLRSEDSTMTTAMKRLLALVLFLPLGAAAADPLRSVTALGAETLADARGTMAATGDDLLVPLSAATPFRLAVGALSTPLPGHGSQPDGFRAGLAMMPAAGRGAGLRAELSWFEARPADARGAAEPDRDAIARRGLLLRISRPLGSY
jgi:hypothetical protein